jgi:Lipase (class 3)
MPPPAPFNWPIHAPKWNAVDAYWWTTLSRASYANTGTYLSRALGWAGPVSGFQYFPPSADFPPGLGFGLLPDRMVVVITGTTAVVQFLSYFLRHAFDAQTQEPSQGWWINTSWWNASDFVLQRMQAAWNTAGQPPLEIIGHSMGAAVGGAVAGRLIGNQERLSDRLVTLGSPRWGTASLCTALRFCQEIAMTTENDPIVLQPPPALIVRLAGLLAPGVPLAGGDYSVCTGLVQFARRGGVDQVGQPNLSVAAWTFAVLQWAASTVGIDNHLAPIYAGEAQRWWRWWSIVNRVSADFVGVLDQVNADLAAIGL